MDSLASFDKIKSIGLVGGMLLCPEYHANNFRIERLLHLLVAECSGDKNPRTGDIKRWLNEYAAVANCRMMDDPPEDTFIGKVATQWGDYRLYGGLWESHCFFLQRILNVIETMPQSIAGPSLIRPIKALLAISEEIARRNKVRLNLVAASQDKSTINPPNYLELVHRMKTLYFSEAELNTIGCSSSEIRAFILPVEEHKSVKDDEHGMTKLVLRPLLQDGDNILVVLPTAFSWTIRLFFFKWLQGHNLVEKFNENLSLEYHRLLMSLPTLGRFVLTSAQGAKKIHDANFLDFVVMIDKGRYLHLVIVVDTLKGLWDRGINNAPEAQEQQSDEVDRRLKLVYNQISKAQEFSEGLSLIVMCGYGRAKFFGFNPPGDQWDVCAISANDLETMSWMSGSNMKSIWRFVKHENRLIDLNVEFFNINGLLNLYGWWEECDHMLVPTTMQIGSEKHNGILVPTHCIGRVRRRAWERVDHRSAQYIDGSFKQVRRKNISFYFKEDYNSNLYVSLPDIARGKMLGCVLTKRRAWWLSVAENSLSDEMRFRNWDAIHNWLGNVAKVLDHWLLNSITSPVLIELDMSLLNSCQRLSDYPKESREGPISIHTVSGNTIRIKLHPPFDYLLNNPKNISETAVVRSIVLGFMDWASITHRNESVDRLLRKIIPNEDARHIHSFQAKNFREEMRVSIKASFEKVDKSDRSLLWVGLGHFSSTTQRRIDGKDQCTKYLNGLVDYIYQKLRAELKRFSKKDLMTLLLRNIEGIAAERGQWERTMKAVLNLRRDGQSVFEGKAKHFSELSFADIACRILIEIAICECPTKGEIEASKFDLSSLMAKAQMIFEFGNISDGISKEEIEPSVLIMPNGDVQTDQSFRIEIFQRTIRQYEDRNTKEAIDSYAESFDPGNATEEKNQQLEEQFVQAVKAEFGVEVTELRNFLQEVEDIGRGWRSLVYSIRLSELLERLKFTKYMDEASLIKILDEFSLKSRSKWEMIPKEYVGRDLYPWLFRRRLSFMMKPLLRLDDSDDPEYLIAPGFCQVSFMYLFNLYRGCEIEADRCKSEKMKSWIGEESHRRGHLFVEESADVLRGLDFSVREEIPLTAIFPKEMLDRDYGDFDLIAWRPGQPKVFLIECKKLFFTKTFREMAEQLQQFKGISKDGEDDRLKKHLNRIDIAFKGRNYIAKYCQLSIDFELIPLVLFSDPVPALYGQRQHEVRFLHLQQIKTDGLL